MIELNNQQINQVTGALSSGEVATAAALSGKTLVEGLVGGYSGGGIDITSTAINTAATFLGVYGGFYVYHYLTD